MLLGLEAHLLAGVGALTVAAGALVGGVRLRRTRVLVLLCLSLAIWNLGIVVLSLGGERFYLRALFLAGSCASGPLGLDLTLRLTGQPRRSRRALLGAAWSLAVGLWLALFVPGAAGSEAWALSAIGVLGLILGAAIAFVARAAWTAPPGPRRSLFVQLLIGALIAAVGGLSDFVPRRSGDWPVIGPLAVLVLLVVLCSAVIHTRYLDVHVLIVRAAALIAGAAAVTLAIDLTLRHIGGGVLTLYTVVLPLLAAAVPLGSAILRRTARPSPQAEAITRALVDVTAGLPSAETAEDVERIIEAARAELPSGMLFAAYASDGGRGFRRLYQRSPEDLPLSIEAEAPLLRLLRERPSGITAPELAAIVGDGEPADPGFEAAQAELRRLGLVVVVPLGSGADLVGLVGLGGPGVEGALGAELCASLRAVGQQAIAALGRIEALERAKRREALAAVGEMAAGLAHEVQNPVASIRGAAQVLLAEARPEAAEREMLAVIEEETARLGRVVHEFLEYARPGDPRREVLDVGDLVRRCRRNLEAAGMPLELDAQLVDCRILGDADQLQRALENLLRNAWEASDGAAKVRVVGERVSTDPPTVRLSLLDEGPGFAEEDLPEIFRPFFTRNKPGGTGLGLALVQRVVEGHGGRISARNADGGGAEIRIELEAAPEERR